MCIRDRRYTLVPLKKDGNRLTIAMNDPTNFYAIDDVRMVSGCDISIAVSYTHLAARMISDKRSVFSCCFSSCGIISILRFYNYQFNLYWSNYYAKTAREN